MELSDLLAVPFMMAVHSVEHEDGTWTRRAEYPELPGCVAEATSALEAMELVEMARVRYLCAAHARGEEIKVTRPPLHNGVSGLSGVAIHQILEQLSAAPGETEPRS